MSFSPRILSNHENLHVVAIQHQKYLRTLMWNDSSSHDKLITKKLLSIIWSPQLGGGMYNSRRHHVAVALTRFIQFIAQ